MLRVLCLISIFSFSLISAVGFKRDTLVVTSTGRLKPIDRLLIGDQVISYNKNFEEIVSTIKGISTINVDSVVDIITEEYVSITVSLMERFYLPKEGSWVYAKDLQVGDSLLNQDLELVEIKNIEHRDEAQELYYISVDGQHNFLVTEGHYLVHNGSRFGLCAYWATKSFLYGVAGGTVAATAAYTGGTAAAAMAASTGTTTAATTLVTGSAANIAASVIATTAAPTAASGAAIAGTTAAVGMIAGAEAGIAAGAAATGVSTMVTMAGAPVIATEGAGLCAFAACAIESVAVGAFCFFSSIEWLP